MKHMRKILALLLSVILTLGMASAAFAANTNTHTITINNSKTGHAYEAYQIFAGDVSGGKLTNIQWGEGVDTTGQNFASDIKKVFSDLSDGFTAEDVADKLKDENLSAGTVDKFAKAIGKHLSTTYSTSSEPSDEKYTISVTGDGYYLIKDEDGSLVGTDGDAYTKYILKVVENISIEPKSDVPTLTKKITEDNTEVDYNAGFVGDQVSYKLTSKVPHMEDFDKYYFIVHDTLDEGLTFNNDVKILMGTEELGEDAYEVVVPTEGAANPSDGCTFEIVFKNFIQYKQNTGASITITYSATINQKAVVGNDGNKNTAQLEYSNDPNIESTGTGDTPGEGDVTGKTPESKVTTYVTGIQLTKVKEDGQTTLTGAKFKIAGTRNGNNITNKVVFVNKEIFRVSETGSYYRLKDGTYTDTAATEDTAGKYESTTTKYEKVTVVNKETVKTDIVTEGWVDENGVLTFSGLGEGQYTITELVAPDGYNLLKSPITISTKLNINATTGAVSWSAVKDGTALSTNNDGLFSYSVVNKSGAALPETGDIGTTIFYIVGTILVIGVGVILIARKRMKME